MLEDVEAGLACVGDDDVDNDVDAVIERLEVDTAEVWEEV